jgi:putative transcriptional regulator
MSETTLRGRLLVATPGSFDPNFHDTVVLVLEHNEEGALGVVLNRPSQAAVAEVLPDWEPVAAAPSVVFVGGPVQPNAVIGLVRARSPDVTTVDLGSTPEKVTGDVKAVRVFAGYAGWGPGQLEAEIEAGGWFVVEAEPDDATSPRPDDLWRMVLRRQRGRLALFAAFPPDPTMN